MQDDEITLFNTCTDLVSLRKAEAFPRHLLQSKRPGDWVSVREVCEGIGVPVGGLRPAVFATWLPDPMAHVGYAVILFYDDESKWSMAAHYNRSRLVGGATPNPSLPPTGSAISPSTSSTPQQAAPAAIEAARRG
jgi:hypothetical protein